MITDPHKEKAAGGNHAADKIEHLHLTKPAPSPQAPLLWQAHRECYQRMQRDPSPINRAIARTVAEQWKITFIRESLS